MEKIFFYIANLSSIIPILVFFIYYKFAKIEKSIWVIMFYSFFVLLTLAFYLLATHLVNNYFFSGIYLFEYLFFSFFLYYAITIQFLKKIIIALIIIITILFFIYIGFFGATNQYDPILVGGKAILLISMSVLFFYEKMQKPSADFIYEDYRFWVILGILIYISGTFFAYIFYNSYQSQLTKFIPYLYLMYTLKSIFHAYSIYIFKNNVNKSINKSDPIPFLDFE